MADVVVYHHSLGLTDGVRACADGLRTAGHTVRTPDLYGGRTFETIEDGMAHAERLGFPDEIVARGKAAAESLASDVYYVGFSLGAMPAQSLFYPGPEHLFAEHDDQQRALLVKRVLAFFD